MFSKEKFGYHSLEDFLKNFNLTDDQVLNIYLYGSRVYGTFNEKSDYDFIVVVKNDSLNNFQEKKNEETKNEDKKSPKSETNVNNNNNKEKENENTKNPYETHIKGNNGHDATLIKEDDYQKLLSEHKWSVIECYFLPPELIVLERKKISVEINLFTLRSSFSKVSGNSYQKAKKKLIIQKDYNPKVAKKSLFHSLRIIMFAIQICKFGKITNYSEANEIWQNINSDPSLDWDHYHLTWKKKWNNLKTELRESSPKSK